jgi:hypothetical protein
MASKKHDKLDMVPTHRSIILFLLCAPPSHLRPRFSMSSELGLVIAIGRDM